MKDNRQEEAILCRRLGDVYESYPSIRDMLYGLRLENLDLERSVLGALQGIPDQYFADFDYPREQLLHNIVNFIIQCETEDSVSEFVTPQSITIFGGHDKSGKPEVAETVITKGSITSIVGPTGAGKSRLLEDLECLAQGDTPTGRRILLNGQVPSDEIRFSSKKRMVAQLSQNMNFVMDLSVYDFLMMHANSRNIRHKEACIQNIYDCASNLSGETFSLKDKVTQLSGGQSRALMIADILLLSNSPIILIDEIENAGIDRKKAISLFSSADKYVFLATHDPLLALSADQRLVIQQGGIQRVLHTSECEAYTELMLEAADRTIQNLRDRLRGGDVLQTEPSDWS